MKNTWDNTQIVKITILPQKPISRIYNIETEEQKSERLERESFIHKMMEKLGAKRKQYKLTQRV